MSLQPTSSDLRRKIIFFNFSDFSKITKIAIFSLPLRSTQKSPNAKNIQVTSSPSNSPTPKISAPYSPWPPTSDTPKNAISTLTTIYPQKFTKIRKNIFTSNKVILTVKKALNLPEECEEAEVLRALKKKKRKNRGETSRMPHRRSILGWVVDGGYIRYPPINFLPVCPIYTVYWNPRPISARRGCQRPQGHKMWAPEGALANVYLSDRSRDERSSSCGRRKKNAHFSSVDLHVEL